MSSVQKFNSFKLVRVSCRLRTKKSQPPLQTPFAIQACLCERILAPLIHSKRHRQVSGCGFLKTAAESLSKQVWWYVRSVGQQIRRASALRVRESRLINGALFELMNFSE